MKIKSLPDKNFRTASDAVLDDLARLVVRVCDVPIALVSSVDAERQWCSSNESNLTPEAFCGTLFYIRAIRRAGVIRH